MERVLKPVVRLVAAAVTVVVGAIALYLFAVLNVYIIAWIVQLLQKLG
jgi:hypothetical protein